MIIWSKLGPDGPQYLSLGSRIIVKDERISVKQHHNGEKHNGSTLVITLAKEEDAGSYVCGLGASGNQEITHTVSIRAPPKITKEPKNGLERVKKGATVTIRCVASGEPAPVVKWTRIGKRLPDGRHELEADELSFQNVDRHHSGIYVCTANNGYGESVKEKIEIEVEYPPEVTAEQLFIHAATGNSVELVCNVHAHPTPVVKWFKNSMELTGETTKLEKRGHRHILVLQSVSKSDWGNYTCSAQNREGFQKRILEVSGADLIRTIIFTM